MKHPFEVVMKPDETPEARPSRRSVLGRMLGAFAAVLGFGSVASAQGSVRQFTTAPLSEEGGGGSPTYIWGEMGSGWRATTYAYGEEGGGHRPPWQRPPWQHPPTTYALGEEGTATTYALGEEGGGPTTRALGEEGGVVTTQALGEEGGGVTTQATGEEGGRR